MFKDEYLSFKGQAIHFRTYLPDDAEPVACALIIPCPGGGYANYRRVLPELKSAGIMCVIADPPGFGGSGVAARASQKNENRAGILWGVLDQLDERAGRTRAWHIIAHGSAATIALFMARSQPDSVASLVLLCPVYQPPMAPLAMFFIKRGFGNEIISGWYKRNVLNRANFAELVGKIYGARLPDPAVRELRAPVMRKGSLETITRLLIEGYALPDEAFSPQCPTLVIRGGRDKFDKYRARELAGAEEHVIRQAAHCPMETNSRAVCDFLRGWYRTYL